MEDVRDWKQRRVVGELTVGKEAADQLRKLLQPYSCPETGAFLIENIVSSFENALWILASEASTETKRFINQSLPEICEESPKHKKTFKKRKLSAHRNEQVKVCTGTPVDGSLDDGNSWRKYGQKKILGSSFPRGYFRCTHRYNQGCLAVKHVQRSDEDPNSFRITYKGRHTCNQTPLIKENAVHCIPQKPEVAQDMNVAGAEGLLVKLENSDAAYTFTSPSFFGSEETNFTESIMNLFAGSIFPSPTDFDYDFQLSESDFSDVISTPTSVGYSSTGEFDFCLDKVDIDPDFPLHDLDSSFEHNSLQSRVIL